MEQGIPVLMKVLLAAIFVLIALMASSTLYSGPQPPPSTDREFTISGTLASAKTDPGTIYILAIPLENSGKIREVETEARPYASRYVAGYTTLGAPGSYRIRVAEPGDYVVYAWKDTDGDGGIDHEDYRDPSGWYRTDDYLPPVSVNVGPGRDAAGIDLALTAPTPYPDEELSVSRGGGGGTLKTIKGYPVLQLRGTDEERAYAQGYLVGPQIRDWIEYVLVEFYARSPSLYEKELLPFIRSNFSNEAYGPIADEMLRGMQDSGTDLALDALDRDMTRDDILAINSLYCLVHLRDSIEDKALSERNNDVMCSSAVVWGDLTENDELAGRVVYGKNMDGENDLRKVTVNTLLIVATEPEEGSGNLRVVGIDWPGFYGTYNAMNEEGLILGTHSSGSVPNFGAANLLEYTSLYMETLQRCGTIAEAEAYWESRNVTRTGGWNTAVAMPYTATPGAIPSATFESDSYGMAVRRPGDIPPTGLPAILTTNNFYVYTTGGDPVPVLPTHYRYRAMNDTLNRFISEGRSIGTAEMIGILQAASNTTDYRGITEYSYIGYPDAMSFAVAREDLDGKILDASYTDFTTFSFEEVFP